MQPNLVQCIKSGSIYLFLGQYYFYQENPLIKLIEQEYRICAPERGHDVFLQLKEDANFSWITQCANMMLPPERLKTIAQLPWNGVLTSSVDGIMARAFKTSWREVQSYCNARNPLPGSLSSREKMIVSELFSNVFYDYDETFSFPKDQRSFRVACVNATHILSKYREEFISPMAVLFIDGYLPNTDWLNINDLLSGLPQTHKAQIHYFGGSLVECDDLWKDLVEGGIIVEHDDDLATYLLKSSENGVLDFDELICERANDKVITVKKKTYYIPIELYRKISQDAIVLDDNLLIMNPLPRDEELRKAKFRQFLYQSGTSPVWEGYEWGFSFERVAEKHLIERIDKSIDSDINVSPIIIEGQAGAGKSVLLGKIAYYFKKQEELPVLFIPQMNNDIVQETVREFCDWVERTTSPRKILIFWDSSTFNDEIAKYINLSAFLQSLGKKVLIIGTSLPLSAKLKKTYRYDSVKLSVKLALSEKKSICSIFSKYSGKNLSMEELGKIGDANNVFVMVYRFLPPSRFNLRRGIIEEARKNVITMREAISLKEKSYDNPIVEAFYRAGVLVTDEFKNSLMEQKVDLRCLLEYICIPAQFGLYAPLDLILRCFNPTLVMDIARKIDEVDFFTFIEDEEGEWLLGVRTSLEAALLLRSELSNIDKQVEIIKQLILKVNQNMYSYARHSDMSFLISLLKAIGPNGRDSRFYEGYFLEIAKTLERLRVEKHIRDSRVVLQEAMFIREYAKKNIENSLELIIGASELLKEAIEEYRARKNRNNYHLGHMYCELGANFGAQIIKLIQFEKVDWERVKGIYEEQLSILHDAQELSPESFYPLDICAWTVCKILNKNVSVLFSQEVYMAAVFLYDMAAMSSPSLFQLEEYHSRLMEINEAYGNIKESVKEFNCLIEKRSGRGLYFSVRNKLQRAGINLEEVLISEQKKTCRDLALYLGQVEYREIVWNDIYCLYMLFRLKWAAYTGHPIIYKEKMCLSFNLEQWKEINSIIERIFRLSDNRHYIVLRYIHAIACFHLNDEKWEEIFNDIANLPYPSHKRIIINYIASSSDGKPQEYEGTLISGDDERRTWFRVRIGSRNKRIPYFSAQFARQSYTIDQVYHGIELGFNFLGVQVSSLMGGR